MSILVQELTKTYGTQKAINNISFEAKKGEILGFLGPNGAGKSTTMKIATGYLSASSGDVFICGHSVSQESLHTKALVGYLPENNPLYLDMYVQEYLYFVAQIRNLKQKQEKIREIIGLCGLDKEKHKRIGALSKGYKQRVGLAQALVHEPSVLILDEPTTGLDPNQILEIRQVIKDVSYDKTLIFSTHILQEVQALCQRVVIVNAGSVVANSSVEELKSSSANFCIEISFALPFDLNFFKNMPIQEIKDMGNLSYQIYCSTDIRADIFSLVAQNGGILIGMTKKESSLEQIFQSLTLKQI